MEGRDEEEASSHPPLLVQGALRGSLIEAQWVDSEIRPVLSILAAKERNDKGELIENQKVAPRLPLRMAGDRALEVGQTRETGEGVFWVMVLEENSN